MTTADTKRLSWLNELVGSGHPVPPDRSIEEVCWADAKRTYETPALMHLLRKLTTYPYLCSHSVKMSLHGNQIKIDDFNPLHHWSRMFEYPWAAHVGEVRKTHRVLDAGGGHGPLQYWLAERAGCVVNLDGDIESLAHVRRVQDEYGIAPNLETVVGDLRQPRYCDWQFDSVFCISVLEHIPEWQDAASELFRLVRPGGLFVFTTDVVVEGKSEEFRNTPDDLDRFLKSWGYAGPRVMDLKGRSVGYFEGCKISALCVKVRKH